MKAKTFIEAVNDIHEIVWESDALEIDAIIDLGELYSRPFKPEDVTELFEGWEVIGCYFDQAEDIEIPNEFYHQRDNRWINYDGDDLILGFRECDEFVEELKFPHPGNLDNFLVFVSHTWNKNLDWKGRNSKTIL